MAIEDSILRSTKKKLNVNPDDPSFDTDLIDFINSAFTHLLQLGVGPTAGFQIEDEEAKWTDFLPEEEDQPLLNAVKTNVHLRVRGIFDPPQIANVMAAHTALLQESDWRINTIREETEWAHPEPIVVVDGGDPSGEL